MRMQQSNPEEANDVSDSHTTPDTTERGWAPVDHVNTQNQRYVNRRWENKGWLFTFDHGYPLPLLHIPDADISVNASRDNLAGVGRPCDAHSPGSVKQHVVLQLQVDQQSNKYGKWKLCANWWNGLTFPGKTLWTATPLNRDASSCNQYYSILLSSHDIKRISSFTTLIT